MIREYEDTSYILNEQDNNFHLKDQIREDEVDLDKHKINEKDRSNIDKVYSLIDEYEFFGSRAQPVIRLHLFNFLSRFESEPDPILLKAEIKKLRRLEQIEFNYDNKKSPLPSIGIEIELPFESFTLYKERVLNELEIPNYTEYDREGDMKEPILQEVNADYSYSPHTQAQMIQELAKLKIIPLRQHEKSKLGQVDNISFDPLSLHVNFGIPEEIEEETIKAEGKKYARIVNSCLNLAFTSAQRMRKRKTRNSTRIDERESSHKDKEVLFEKNDLLRLELTPFEFKNYSTFRMLFESQNIIAMLFAYYKYLQKDYLTPEEKQLLPLWKQFYKENADLHKKHNIDPLDMDIEKNDYGRYQENKLIVAEARQLINKYAKAVNTVVKPIINSKSEQAVYTV